MAQRPVIDGLLEQVTPGSRIRRTARKAELGIPTYPPAVSRARAPQLGASNSAQCLFLPERMVERHHQRPDDVVECGALMVGIITVAGMPG